GQVSMTAADDARRITVIGSVAFDTLETPQGRADDELGGAATHFAVAAAFFAPVSLVAPIGDDFPREGRAYLESRGIDCAGLVKRGEYGAILFSPDSVFAVPAFPLEQVFDPTGAGDTFAGGLMGHLAATGDVEEPNLRRAIVYGTVLASFVVEDFGGRRMRTL